MPNVLRNEWRREPGHPFERAVILEHHSSPEGLEAGRIRFVDVGRYSPPAQGGHLLSLIAGTARLEAAGTSGALRLEVGAHLFVPVGHSVALEAGPGTELVYVSAPGPEQVRGTRLLVRDEAFVAAAAVPGQALRWVLTPQYLSRRIFLHHDPVLLSRAGRPVSWFRTTMFDVAGLPTNEDGENVFKMSYDSRTEFNICYEVTGQARVRMARHPYRESGQVWGPWAMIDGETTYHLDEPAPVDGHRNKHEVHAAGGQVTLFCLFDPAPVGIERHRPGAYSDYEPIEVVRERPEFRTHQAAMARFDEMVDRLSLAKAAGQLSLMEGSPWWTLYLEGQAAQRALEASLARALAQEGGGRERVIEPWRS